jgi:hypothetical protein
MTSYTVNYALITPGHWGGTHPMSDSVEASSYAEAVQAIIDDLTSQLDDPDDDDNEGDIYNFYVIAEDGSKVWGLPEDED